jgi:hypothetical protein
VVLEGPGDVSDTSSLYAQRERICAFASAHRLPAIGRVREFAEAGCLVSYGQNQAAM